jgi:hypothetical protein
MGFAQNISDFIIEDWEGEITILGYTGSQKDMVIPPTINGASSFTIGQTAFKSKGLTSVTIPNSVTSIGAYAFSLNQLVNVTIPDSVIAIGGAAFANNQLTSVTISNSVIAIESYAFQGNQLTSITIPNSVTFIGSSAFDSNPLTSITIGDNVALDYSFGKGFDAYYKNNDRRGGTFVYRQSTGQWYKR